MATQTQINTGYNKGMHPLCISDALNCRLCCSTTVISEACTAVRACLSLVLWEEWEECRYVQVHGGLVPLPCPLLNTLLTDRRCARRSVFSSSRKHEGTEDKPFLFIAALV